MPESFLQWDAAQVLSYLRPEVGDDISSEFIENNIDGSLLPFLTTDHLKELGVVQLSARLRAKKAINELIASHYSRNPPTLASDPEFRLTSININSNYVSMEALTLSLLILRDMAKSSKIHSTHTQEQYKKLNENFNKLKTDLNPVLRLVKESKPLPTPTLDPGIPQSLPTYLFNSVYSANSTGTDAESILPTSGSSNTIATLGTPTSTTAPTVTIAAAPILPNLAPNLVSRAPASPTSKRFSSGSVLSMGVGKLADIKPPSRLFPKPRLVESKSLPSGLGTEAPEHAKPTLKSKPSSASVAQAQPPLQPLKQLKASLDDTCLKILQQAMKRHHIPRDNWSKYVLVVCYGDKERILKLTEKPVIVFKELQEHGKNPAIMLRELATSTEEKSEEEIYEDSRIGSDIPGGTL